MGTTEIAAFPDHGNPPVPTYTGPGSVSLSKVTEWANGLRPNDTSLNLPRPDPFEDNLGDVFDEMMALLIAKRQAYGPNNLVRFGALGIVIRASDKIDRLANLLKAGETTSADGESIEDAFKDLVGYGVLGLLYERGKLVP